MDDVVLKMNKEINLGICQYKYINKDWIISGPTDTSPKKTYNLLNYKTNQSYSLSKFLIYEYKTTKQFEPLIFGKRIETKLSNSNNKHNSIMINIVNDVLYIIEYSAKYIRTHTQESNPQNRRIPNHYENVLINECKVIFNVSKLHIDCQKNKLKLLNSKIIDTFATIVSSNNMWIELVDQYNVLFCYREGTSASLKSTNKYYMLMTNIDQLSYNFYNVAYSGINYQIMESGSPANPIIVNDLFGRQSKKYIYDYWKEYKLIPINLLNNECLILNFKTNEEYKYNGQIYLRYNQFNDIYEYELNNNCDITIVTFESNNKKLTCRNKLIFDVELKNDGINITASNNF